MNESPEIKQCYKKKLLFLKVNASNLLSGVCIWMFFLFYINKLVEI